MKKPLYGPSIYYATDKNVFDALNQHKVTKASIQDMLLRRNIIVGKKTPRLDLAKYFAQLGHDYQDHQDIAKQLGVVARRDRTTSMIVGGIEKHDELLTSVNELKTLAEDVGDVVRITKSENRVTVVIHYSTIDYRRSEFTQHQRHSGRIEFIKRDGGYVVRTTNSHHMVQARDSILEKLACYPDTSLQRTSISLFGFTDPTVRSSFFSDLINGLSDLSLLDVKEVFAYKARPQSGTKDKDDESDDEDGDEGADEETNEEDDEADGEALGSHVERVNLKGDGVTRSELLIDALEDDYYIVRVRWEAKKLSGQGQVYVIDARFDDPATCAEFSFMLKGVFPVDAGKLSTRQITPSPDDINLVSHAIETKALELIAALGAANGKGKD